MAPEHDRNTMKILYFYQYFGTSQGSWSTRVHEFGRRWVASGDSVTVVTSVYDKSDLKPRKMLSTHQIDGITVKVINVTLSNKHGFAWRLVTFLAYSLMACWYALVLPADVVIASSGPITVGLPGLVAHWLRRRPLVFEVRDLWPEGAIELGVLRSKFLIRIARRMERTCYRAATRIIALSPAAAEWIEREHHTGKVDIVPNASDNDLFGAAGNGSLPDWAEHTDLVVYTGTIGRMDDCRQIVRMAECLQRHSKRSITVVLIGDGQEREAVEAYVRDNRIMNVRFLGLMPKTEVAAWLRHARCALLSFRSVPVLDTVSPNKLFDALAAGVPVVQTTQGWIKALLAREECGITVAPEDPGAMAEAVVQVVRQPELRDRLADNARRVAREQFDRDMLASRYREILESVVAAHG